MVEQLNQLNFIIVKAGETLKTKMFQTRQRNFNFLSHINIEVQILRKPSGKEDCNLRKAFNEEVANKESGWLTKMRHLLETYRISNLILNTLKVLRDEIEKKKKGNISFSKKN